MTKEQALVPHWISTRNHSLASNFAMLVSGVVLMAALAQVVIPLPLTPVPITGQTFGVLLVALLWGRSRGTTILSAYVGLGALGVPLLAATTGATFGYLVGMIAAAWVIGGLADRGWTRSFKRAAAAGVLGMVFIYAFGLIGLSIFLPFDQLLMAGLIPFLPGAAIKLVLAASIATTVSKKFS